MAEQFYGANFEYNKEGTGMESYKTEDTDEDVLVKILSQLDEYSLGPSFNEEERYIGEIKGREIEVKRTHDQLDIFLEEGTDLEEVLEPDDTLETYDVKPEYSFGSPDKGK